jgi:hypothetical protein
MLENRKHCLGSRVGYSLPILEQMPVITYYYEVRALPVSFFNTVVLP